MRLSVIISVYNKPAELELVLAALERQSFKKFEIVIADDGSGVHNEEKIKAWKLREEQTIVHVRQEKKGFRKTRILNKAVVASNTAYLIFIDGDCIPHPEFVEQHYVNRSEETVLCGGRVMLSKTITDRILDETISLPDLYSNLFRLIGDSFRGKKNRSYRVEEGLLVKSNILNKLLIPGKPRLSGCNFSIHKNLLMKVNGFNEDYSGPGIGEDTDIEFRLKLAGARFKSVRRKAVLYHLFHEITIENPDNPNYFRAVKSRRNYVCENGIRKLNAAS